MRRSVLTIKSESYRSLKRCFRLTCLERESFRSYLIKINLKLNNKLSVDIDVDIFACVRNSRYDDYHIVKILYFQFVLLSVCVCVIIGQCACV